MEKSLRCWCQRKRTEVQLLNFQHMMLQYVKQSCAVDQWIVSDVNLFFSVHFL